MITTIGFPFDDHSSFLRGPAKGPAAIRKAFHSPSSNYFSETGTDLQDHLSLVDVGDLDLSDTQKIIEKISKKVEEIVKKSSKIVCLGGDHSITYPIIKGVSAHYDNLNILHIDAHADVYDDFEGNKFSHACPFARIMESKLAKRLVQVGIRTLNDHQRNQIKKFGIETIEMRDWTDHHKLKFDGPLYISLDMDAFDPAYAPGVSHHEPGGFTTRQVISLIQNLEANIIGADIVELNPDRDVNGITATLAAKMYKEIHAKMINPKTRDD
ncbi:MAG: agmatinase [Flammeovirgaceae bacterium]|nr:agmatinase [Flammeovirgaceae bacterium]